MFKTKHKTPAFSVVLHKSQKEITHKLNNRLISLELEDNRGFTADTLNLNLSDHDGKLAFPKRGEKLEVSLGWQGEALTPKGIYLVDEVSYQGSPDVLTIRAKSADLMGDLASGKERSFHDKTIGQIVEQIAQENKLIPHVGDDFKNQKVGHIDQNAESTINFLSRLAQEHDAIATVKQDKLLFTRAGECKTASGKPLPKMIIQRNSGDGFSFTLSENTNYTEVVAYYHETASGKRGKVSVKAKQEKGKEEKENTSVTSDSKKVKTIRHTYKSKQAAQNAVKRALSKVERGKATFSITLAEGRAELFPELPVEVRGFKAEIDGTEWLIVKVNHKLDGNGFTTSLELEIKI